MIDADTPDIQLYVRNKHPEDMSQVPPEHVLLYVHGATQPSEATFDLQLEGMSWMDYIARQGWDVYLMDARGYGGSTRSPEFAQVAANQAPVVSSHAKLRDLGTVIDFILKRRGISKISLLGWSWGTIIAAAYSANYADRVGSLILYAPVWCDVSCTFDPQLVEAASTADAKNPGMQSIVESSMEATRTRLQSGVPPGRRDELLPKESFEAWSAAVLATDPVGAKKDPPVLRVPPGVSRDLQEYWDQGKSFYDPTLIVAPTLVVVAEWDEVTPPRWAEALYESLENSEGRRLVQLSGGSHIMMIEKNRMSLFETIQQFLVTPGAPH